MKTSSADCVLALDAGGTAIKGALVTKEHAISDFFEVPVPDNGDTQAITSAFTDAGKQGAASAASRGFSLSGIGVCIPGPFDYQNGASLMDHKYLSIRGLPLSPCITKATGRLPIRYMHDSSAFLLGELTARPKPAGDLCAAIIGTGLGFACTKDGHLFENENGGPGISIFRRAFRGETAEDFISKRGILRTYARLGGHTAGTVKDIAALAFAGDTTARNTFEETGTILGEILAPILLNHHFFCMILGGQIAKAGTLLTDPVQQVLRQKQIPCYVETAKRLDESPLLGAAEQIFNSSR